MSGGSPRQGRSRVGGFILMWIIGPLVVLGLLVIGLVRNPPTESLLELVQHQFRTRTGYDLSFDASSTIKLWPKGEIDLKGVEIRRPALYPTIGGLIADARSVSARFDLITLIVGPRAIDAIDIREANFTLHEADVRLLRTNLAAYANPGAPPVTVRALTLNDAYVTYHVKPPNPAFALTELEAVFSDIGRAGVENFTGRFAFKEEPVTFTGSAKTSARRDGVDLTLSLDSEKATAALEGVASQGERDGDFFNGEALVRLPEAGPALRWFGVGLEKDHPALAGAMTLTGPVTLKQNVIRFRDVLFKSALADGRGEVTADFSGARAKLTGQVDWDRVDLEGIAQPVRGPQSLAVVSRTTSRQPEGLVIPSLWDELQDYLRSVQETGAAPRSASLQPRRESDAPVSRRRRAVPLPLRRPAVDLSFLEMVDLNVMHTAERLTYNGFELGDIKLDTELEAGRLAVRLKEALFASGRWTGTFDVDARPAQPNLTLKLSGTGIEAAGLQQAAIGRSTLEGRGDIRADLEAKGQDAERLVKSLSGTIKIDIGEGRLVGYDLKAILTQFWKRWTYDTRRRTPFNKIGARVRLDKGVINTIGYASLRGGEAELDSRGTVSLVAQSLNQRIRARLAWPPNQLPLPARISGPWSSPKVGIDWGIFSLRPGFVDLPPGLRAASLGEPGAEHRAAFAPGPAATVPNDVARDINRVLSKQDVAAKLPPKLRNTLEALVTKRDGTN